MLEEHRIKATYETELSADKPGEWSSIVMELTSPKDPIWAMVEQHLRCAYCGMETRKPIKSIDASATIREHSKKCSEHPLRALEEEIKVLKKMLQKHAPSIQAEFEDQVSNEGDGLQGVVRDVKKKPANPAKNVRWKKGKKQKVKK